MRISFRAFAFLALLASPALAQTQVAVYPQSVTDPNRPAATSTTPAVECGLRPKFVEAPPLLGDELYFDDPSDPASDCRAPIGKSGLATGLYKVAIKPAGEAYSEFSSAFAVSAQAPAHACDGTAQTSGTVVAGTRTLSWCYPDNATGGSPITGWRVTTGTASAVLTSVTVGATANAAGRRLYSVSLPFVAGTVAIRIAPVNAIGEGALAPIFTLNVQAPATAPTGTTDIRGVN